MSVDGVTAQKASRAIRVQGGRGMEHLHHVIVTEKLSSVEKQQQDEYQILFERQKRIEFLGRVRQLFNNPAYVNDVDGSIDLTNSPEREGLVAEAEAMMEEAEELREAANLLQEQIDALKEIDARDGTDHSSDIKALEERRDALNGLADEIEDTVNATHLLDGTTKYSREQRHQVKDNMETQSGSLKNLNTYQHTKVQRLQSELMEILNLIKSMMSRIHDTKVSTARGIRG